MNARYRMLCPSLIKLGYRAVESKETTCMLMKNSIEMAKKIDDVLSKQASVNEQENDAHAPSCPQKSSEKVVEENQPHNPHVFKANGLKKKEGLGKGRPKKRPKSWVELQPKVKKSRRKMGSQSAPQPSITDSTIQDNMLLYVPVFEDRNMDQSPLHPQGVEMPNPMSWMIPETPQAWNHLSFTHLLQESLLCPSIEDFKGSSSAQYKNDMPSIDDGDPMQLVLVKAMLIFQSSQFFGTVRKLPTNVGAQIRKCVYSALEKGPPDWAKKILEHSISKEVYKGNASTHKGDIS
ncbi:Methyl-CpG-binding domain-containing protein 9 [Camellia lanceoleosa]|uniref:Methyl-CpG-binding domain-containing protein 9 n=1 Tax=Camellia lanceoleosa TaxID=1840588 RepID=A0ACC0IA54_9ERIC|nr:Methyl-CpG-binding domain-containing protein 9 [Camellia lanceoleosa]